MINLLPSFHGMENENPYRHIRDFEELCNTFCDQNWTQELVHLKLFSFSIKDKAKDWFLTLAPNSIGTWQELQDAFLKEFFPIHKTNSLMKQIQNFTQTNEEPFDICWKRFKALLSQCPHHGYDKMRQLSIFHGGLNPQSKQLIETMCHGSFLTLNANQVEAHFDYVASTSKGWDTSNPYDRSQKPSTNNQNQTQGLFHLKVEDDDIHAKYAQLFRKVEAMHLSQ